MAGPSRARAGRGAAPGELRALVRRALAEDVGAGDATTLGLVAPRTRARGVIRAKAAGVVSGHAVAALVFRALDPRARYEVEVADGGRAEAGAAVATVTAGARAILTGERVALNFLQRLSGIATLTARFVAAVGEGGAAILDTRKTTPGLRALEKQAVATGGGRNHRFGLDDAILVKDNHVAALGDFTRAVCRALLAARRCRPPLPVIVEARTLGQAALAIDLGVDRVLLDNFTPAQVRRAVALAAGEAPGAAAPAGARVEIEVSGGVNLGNVKRYALPGVDCISIGALTHSAPAFDLSLDLEPIAAGEGKKRAGSPRGEPRRGSPGPSRGRLRSGSPGAPRGASRETRPR
ncbi:MAG: carboxylating nicotinate-nucleotide diphosphorylase [Candidatus Eisenbacteria bacterium]|uniref:Probable nicotinate-nucleotide pyrophosphorylase [carboxylating] n=1 Tax=Eiseniibacteriota bacterium TaxID=2212470 RepID=A0A938BQS1_UNCEI|nr:carboxylating nicotinate-nucleotide diphosphorylase [Candidatus Eisenbacteria bacterium]